MTLSTRVRGHEKNAKNRPTETVRCMQKETDEDETAGEEKTRRPLERSPLSIRAIFLMVAELESRLTSVRAVFLTITQVDGREEIRQRHEYLPRV